VLEHVKRLVKDEIVWAPAIEGAFVLTKRGGDFALHLGQDVSIGYLSHSDSAVAAIPARKLYLFDAYCGGRGGAGGSWEGEEVEAKGARLGRRPLQCVRKAGGGVNTALQSREWVSCAGWGVAIEWGANIPM